MRRAKALLWLISSSTTSTLVRLLSMEVWGCGHLFRITGSVTQATFENSIGTKSQSRLPWLFVTEYTDARNLCTKNENARVLHRCGFDGGDCVRTVAGS